MSTVYLLFCRQTCLISQESVIADKWIENTWESIKTQAVRW